MANYNLTQTGDEVQAYIDSIPVIDVTGTLSDSTITFGSNPYSQIAANYAADCSSIIRLTVGTAVYLLRVTQYDGTNYTASEMSGAHNVVATIGSSSASATIDAGIDATPTQGSDNLVKSGGVYSEVSQLGQQVIYDVSANNDEATFASLSALLSSENLSTLIPIAVRCGGMSIRFVQSSDNKYVQFRYMSSSTANADFTNVENWQGVDDEPVAGSDNLVKSGGVAYAFVNVNGVNVSTKSNIHIPFLITEGKTYKITNNQSTSISLYFRKTQSSTGQKLISLSANATVDVIADANYSYLYIYSSSPSEYVYSILVIESDSLKVRLDGAENDISEIQDGVNYLDNEVKKENIYDVVTASAIDIESHRGLKGQILSNGNWYNVNSESDKYAIVLINPGDSIDIKSNTAYGSYIAFLKSYNFPKVNNEPADFCNNESRRFISANTTQTITAPADAKFLYVALVTSNVNYKPVSLLVNSKDPYFNKNIREMINTLDAKASSIESSLSDLTDDVITNAQVTLAGVSGSNVILNTPITLEQDGDSLEVAVHTTLTGTNGYRFSNSGAHAASTAVGIAKNRVSVRAYDSTWIADAAVATTENIKVKIVYEDSKIKVYVDDVLFKTYEGQKKVVVASFGNGYSSFWGGTIKYVKVNGVPLALNKQTLNNVTLQKVYRFLTKEEAENLDFYPKGVLTYNATGKYFVFYSQIGKGNKYISFKVELDEDNSDLVYLKEWRLSTGKLCEYADGVFTEKAELIYNAENEMAMRFSNTIDFTGGIHGDERIDVSQDSFVKFFAGGKLITDLTSDFTIICDSFSYMQLSTLHQTSAVAGEYVSGHPIVAMHYKHNLFKNGCSHIENRITFVGGQRVSSYHAGMFCVGKGAATYALVPIAKATSELDGTNPDILATSSIPAVVNFWNPTTGVSATVEGHFIKGFNDDTDIPITNESNSCGFKVWDRNTDSKYYRRTLSTKQFADGDIIINTQDVKYEL